MNERTRRIGENEAIFRSVNEQVRALNATFSAATNTMRVVCECGARTCTEQIEIGPDDYAEVREDATLFVVRPGHDLPEAEQAVSRHETYWIVRKDPGLPTLIAEATDPRG